MDNQIYNIEDEQKRRKIISLIILLLILLIIILIYITQAFRRYESRLEAEVNDEIKNLNIDTSGDGMCDINCDTNGDGIPDLNIDFNNDKVAHFNVDKNKDQVADFNLMNQDNNHDGVCDMNCDLDNDGWPDRNIDLDGDGICDLNCYEEDDDDDDDDKGKKDNVRCRLNCDTDGDGKPDRNIDLDGDGICDLNCDTEKTVVIEDKDVPKKDDDKKDDKKEEEEKNEGVFEIVFEEIKPLKSELIYPGWKGYYAFKIKNSTVKNIKYNISLVNITNNFTETNNLYYVIKKNGSVIGTEKRAPYHDEKILDNITINAKTEDNYTITYEFKDTNIPQDEDQNKTFKSTVRVAIAE